MRRGTVVEVPPALLVSPASAGEYDIVIMGAGCAGLSFCLALLAEGETGEILLIDTRTDYADDRTWCFWDVEPTPFTHLARASWNSWQVRSADGTVRSTAEQTPYRCLAANDFYRFALDSLEVAGNVSMLTGEAALSYTESDGLVTVTTEHASVTGWHVIDSRGLRPSSAEAARAKVDSTWIPQQFVGIHLRTFGESFDPTECVLMDFDVDQSAGLRFVYALAVSATELLVEDVCLSEPTFSRAEHLRNIDAYLRDRYGLLPADYELNSDETGYIPMTDHRFTRNPIPGVTTLGTLAGATRPSTGYTFLRIHRSTRELARRIVAGAGTAEPDAGRGSLLDSVFLRFLADHPERAPRVFHLLFAGVEPNALVRFLSERSTWVDHARLILALPKGWFLATAFRVVLDKGRHALTR